MWVISLRDLQWRRRRFGIAIVATGLVFALTLVMAGAATGLRNEARRIVALFEADRWLVAAGSSGPFTATTGIPAALADEVAEDPAVERADPVALFPSALGQEAPFRDVNVIGRPPGGLGAPRLTAGRDLAADGEVLADVRLDAALGDTLTMGGADLTVVGLAEGVTYRFGFPTVILTLEDAQALVFDGQPLATAVATRGVPSTVPPALAAYSSEEARRDLERPMKNGIDAIAFVSLLLWVIAAGIVASMVYLSALERSRDFAVLKAAGATNRSLLAGLAVQAVILSAAAAVVGVLGALVIAPGFPFAIEIAGTDYLQLAAIAVAVGLLASLGGLRRVVTADPALAFRSA